MVRSIAPEDKDVMGKDIYKENGRGRESSLEKTIFNSKV
jgi:hypothetical protein